MKTTKHFFIIVSLLLSSLTLSAQTTGPASFFDEYGMIPANLPTSRPLEGVRPIELTNPRANDIFWQRTVYRVIDLRERINFPLFFPESPMDNRQSLFTLIFRLMQEGKVYGFEFMEDREVFSRDFQMDFSHILRTYDIFYRTEVDEITNETRFIISEGDIPNREVLRFFLKEVWFFDKHTSVFNVRTLAIAPVLTRDTEVGLQSFPMFWVPFNMLRPHLAQAEVLLSDHNNGMRISFDDLFLMRRYGSYIYKASNVQNRMILDFNMTAEQVRREQENIRTTILNFEQDLWEY